LPLKLTCEVNQLPPQFQRIEVSPDNSAIREALEAGDIEAQKVAQCGERETHLRVIEIAIKQEIITFYQGLFPTGN